MDDPFSVENAMREIEKRKQYDPALMPMSAEIKDRIEQHAEMSSAASNPNMIKELSKLLDGLDDGGDESSPEYKRGKEFGKAEYPTMDIDNCHFTKHGLTDPAEIDRFQRGYLAGRVIAIGENARKELEAGRTPEQILDDARKRNKIERTTSKKKRTVRKVSMPYGGRLTLIAVYGLSFLAAMAYLVLTPW